MLNFVINRPSHLPKTETTQHILSTRKKQSLDAYCILPLLNPKLTRSILFASVRFQSLALEPITTVIRFPELRNRHVNRPVGYRRHSYRPIELCWH
jgi:hypothetical protein